MVSYGYLSISMHYQRAAFTIHSARLLAQGHGVCLYVANSIIDPEKAGICLRYRCCLFVIMHIVMATPLYDSYEVHYFEDLVVNQSV